MGDYRRHDAPDQNRPKEILSPYAKAALGSTYLLIFLGFIIRGLWGGLAALGAVGIIATSAPNWTRNSFIEQGESRWIARSLEKYYQKEKEKAAEEAALKDKFENPTRLERFSTKAGCLLAMLLFLTMIGLGIADVSLGNVASSILTGALIFCFYPIFTRFSKANALQFLADEPRGGLKTRTLRDFAVYMERWPNRYPLFLVSSILAAIAAIFLA